MVLYKTLLDEDRHPVLVKDRTIGYKTPRYSLVRERFPKSDEFANMLIHGFGADNETEEVVYLFCLDHACHLKATFELSRGTVSSSLVDPKAVFTKALLAGATGIVVAHNHPSGDPSPSRIDTETCKRLFEAGKLLNINLLDFMIVGEKCYVSYVESGYYDPEKGFGE